MADMINERDPFPEDWDDRPATWTMKDGTTILISEMSDSHLVNALRLMDRKGFVPSDELTDFMCGSRPNGDAAMDAWNEALDELMKKNPSNKMADLAAEAMQRDLKWRDE